MAGVDSIRNGKLNRISKMGFFFKPQIKSGYRTISFIKAKLMTGTPTAALTKHMPTQQPSN
jgi:hypothetical protein